MRVLAILYLIFVFILGILDLISYYHLKSKTSDEKHELILIIITFEHSHYRLER